MGVLARLPCRRASSAGRSWRSSAHCSARACSRVRSRRSVELLDEWPKALKGIAKYPDLIPGLKSSLAAYKAACLELPGDFDLLRWWRLKKKDLPFWAQLLRIVLLLAPSSAAVERVFSIMRRTFGKDQDKALGDMIRTSLMLQYNYRNHSRGRAEDRRASFL